MARMALRVTWGNTGIRDKRFLEVPEDLFDKDSEKEYYNRCYCDGRHVCGPCLKQEKNYYGY